MVPVLYVVVFYIVQYNNIEKKHIKSKREEKIKMEESLFDRWKLALRIAYRLSLSITRTSKPYR